MTARTIDWRDIRREEYSMKRLIRRIAALALGLGLAGSVLAGCGSTVKPEDYATTVVASMGDEKIYLDEAVMYLRMDQNYYEMMYTYFYGSTDIWDMEIQTGVTMESNLKQTEMQMIHQMYVLCSHAEEMGIILSDADLAKVEETVDGLRESSSEALLNAIGMDRDRMVEAFKRNALANLVYEEIIKGASTDVTEEEMRCVGVTYVKGAVSEEKAAAGETPESVIRAIDEAVQGGKTLEEAAAANGLMPSQSSYFTGDTFEEGSLGAAALAMAEGERRVLQVGEDWYLLVLDSLRDDEASETKKESVIAERQSALFNETYAAWQEAAPEFKVEEKIWKAVPMTAVFEAPTTAETEAQTEAPAETTAGAEGADAATEAGETEAQQTEAGN